MQSEDIEYSTGAQAALAGYRYQVKVSVLFALDVLANRQEADQITLEPANREDLETELKDEPGALTQSLTIRTRKLVVQCKLRNSGPWTIGEIKSLLVHGRKRTPPKDLLKDPDVSYLLVTSADLSGDARKLLVKGPTRWQRLGSMPSKLSKALPKDADGRVAVWHNLDPERIEHRIKGAPGELVTAQLVRVQREGEGEPPPPPRVMGRGPRGPGSSVDRGASRQG